MINVQTTDNRCFLYAVLSVLHHKDIKCNRHQEASYRKYLSSLKTDGLSFPMKIDDIHKFERMNDIKVNVHLWDKKLLGIRYNDANFIGKRTVNVLLVHYQGLWHYCGIPNLKALYYSHHKGHSRYICERCVRSFTVKNELDKHFAFCSRGKAQIEEMPKQEQYSFKASEKEISPILVCYADFESIIRPVTKIHDPIAASCYSVWHEHFKSRNEQETVVVWDGEDCILSFLKHVESQARTVYQKLNDISRNKIKISPSEESAWKASTSCPKCGQEYSTTNVKVRDHCHISSSYRGPLCSKCNFGVRLTRYVVTVVMHNFRGYDSHHICRNAIGRMGHWNVSVIPSTKEMYLTLSAKFQVDVNPKTKRKVFMTIRFIDSLQFLHSSLASLSANLPELIHTYKMDCMDKSILTGKGHFPYAYLDNEEKLKETSLPPKDAFTSDLTKDEITDEDYQQAQRAWKSFRCQTLLDYLLHYSKLDTYLLADVFELFRCTSLSEDGLDPIHYISLPQLSYDAAFRIT